MNPLVLYLSLVALAALVGVAALVIHRGPRRSCPGCGLDVSQTARACNACRYVL